MTPFYELDDSDLRRNSTANYFARVSCYFTLLLLMFIFPTVDLSYSFLKYDIFLAASREEFDNILHFIAL